MSQVSSLNCLTIGGIILLEVLEFHKINVLNIKRIDGTDECVVTVLGCRSNDEFALLKKIAKACNGIAVKGRDYTCIFVNEACLVDG